MTNPRNSWWLHYILGVCIWSVGFSYSKAAEIPQGIEKIVVSKGIVFTCSHRTPDKVKSLFKNAFYLYSWNLIQSKEICAADVGSTDDPSLRWSVAHQHCWVAMALKDDFPPSRHPKHFNYSRLDFDPPNSGVVEASRLRAWMNWSGTAVIEPLADLANIAEYDSRFQSALFYDYLPISETRLQMFILTNIRGRFKKVPPAEPGDPPTKSLEITDEEVKTPKWSLTVLMTTAFQDKENKDWKWEPWKKTEAIAPLFHEEFQVVARADTYYFLTKSGKVYQSKKPDKGKDRTLEELWADKEQPVVAFVQDADNERTHVFTKNTKKDAQDVYFELADKLKPVAYNLADAKPPKDLKEPLKTALPYVQILIADGKIKAPKPKE